MGRQGHNDAVYMSAERAYGKQGHQNAVYRGEHMGKWGHKNGPSPGGGGGGAYHGAAPQLRPTRSQRLQLGVQFLYHPDGIFNMAARGPFLE